MKSKVSILVFIFLFFAQGCFFNETKFVSIAIADDSWKNWYGIVWRDTDTNTVKYAKQMGYDYVGVKDWNWDYYKNNPDVAGMRFYITDPHLRSDCFADLPNRSSLGNYVAGGAAIDTSIKYTQAQKDWYNRRMVWKSNDPFPNNFAQGYHPTGTTSKFYIVWDVQQQAVIDELIDKIITHIRKYENKSLPFTFAGYILDTPKLSGEFYYIGSDNKERMTDLSYWAGMDSGLVHGTITHEYSTYTEGMAAYYKQLNARLRQEFPGAKWIIEPALLYSDSAPNEWIYSVKNRPDKDELTADFITQEEGLNGNTAFVDDTNIFNSGMNITKSMVGSSQSNEVDEYGNRLIAAKAGINGAWYNWFGRWGGFRSMPNFKYITEVYPRLKLIRCIPNWDNLNNVSLNDRSWDGSVYRSTMSYIDSDVMYSRHPKTGKLFAVFNTTNGVIKLNAGETVISVQNTDGYFIESGNASADFNITGNEIRLKNSVPIAVDSSNGQIKGKGYIFTLSSSSSVPNGSITINSGATYTSSTAVTLALSATDNAGLTGYYLSTSSMVPLASAPGWTAVTSTTSYNANVSYTLSSGNGNKTVYVWYKDAAGNVSNTASDSITLDTAAPAVTITSPTSNSTYTTTNSAISLGGSASDSGAGVSSVAWSNNRGGSGTASGTTSWSIASISLSSGNNIITVTARDGANNTINDTITVTVTSGYSGDLQVFYRFDEGGGSIANDSSGNGNNGTVNGTAWTTGKNAGALSFNGTNSYVSLSDNLAPFTEFTCTAWVKVTDLAAIRGIFTSGDQNGSGFRFRVNQDGSVWLLMAGGGKHDALSTAAGIIQSGTFYHISVSGKSGQYMRIYVNGVLVGEKLTTQAIDTPTDAGYIGTSWNTNLELMKGTIDDVRIYNRTLSGQEILNLYNNDDLQVFYKFDEGSGSIANDSSGNGNNGTVNGTTWTTGKNAGALSFNGTNSYVSLSDSLPSLTEFTCTAWVKVVDLAAIRGIFTSGGMNGNGFRFRVNKDGSVWLLMAGGGKYDALFTAAGVIQNGAFYHISVSGKSGQYMRIYVNGILVKEKTTTQTVDTPAAPGYIGTSWNTNLELMKGTIDDVRIYDRALSDTEIQDLYNQYSFFVLSFMKGG